MISPALRLVETFTFWYGMDS